MASNIQFQLSGDISYVKLCKIVLNKWHWLLGICLFGLICGNLYIYWQQPLFLTSASFKIDEKHSELSELTNIRNIYDRSNRAESERFILQSRNVLFHAIQSLHYDVSFFKKEGFRLKNIYPLSPIDIRIISRSNDPDVNSEFEYYPVSDIKYELRYSAGKKEILKTYKYNQVVDTRHFKFRIAPPNALRSNQTSCIFRINHPEKLLQHLSKALSIDETQNDNIVNLKFTDQNPYFAKDMLNAILKQYLRFDKVQRSASMIQTETFINSLLQTMADVVKSSGKAIQEFKERNRLIDISSSLNTASDRLAHLEAEKHLLDINAIIISAFKNDLQKTGSHESLNYDLQTVLDPQINILTDKYNELMVKKKQALNYYTVNSPQVKKLDDELTIYTKAIRDNIRFLLQNNVKTRNALNKQIDSIHQDLINLPKIEREFIKIQSISDVDQKIFNYLSEKRLEAQISKAAVISGAIIIDWATLPSEPIFPIPRNIYTLCALVSIILGLGLIFFIRFLNPYIYSKEIIGEYTRTPIIGLIRKYRHKDKINMIPVIDDPRSIFSESIRSVRSSINFLAPEKQSKVICVTSEISGEGKSFVTLNIAASLTLIEKKVLLIATDMRKSKLHSAFNISNNIGLSQYLSGQADLADIVKTTHIHGLDFITSGLVPPNPAELLLHNKMETLLKDIQKRYDFILLDSAPLGLVSDGKPLLKMADINLFILRCGVSRHSFATSPEILQKEFNLSNFAIILNDYEENNFHGYYYNYRQLNDSCYYTNQSYSEDSNGYFQ